MHPWRGGDCKRTGNTSEPGRTDITGDMNGKDRQGMFRRMSGEKDNEVNIKLLIDIVQEDEAAFCCMKDQVMIFEGIRMCGSLVCQEGINAAPDVIPRQVKGGMNERDFQRASPSKETDMVNPISLYTYYCYYGRTGDTSRIRKRRNRKRDKMP
jgi:hypothetical protein